MQVVNSVGKLCEAFFRDPLTQAELTDIALEIRRLVTAATEPLVFCCDWRRVSSFDKSLADTTVWVMRRDNPKIAYNGILIDPKNTALREQVDRIVKEAGNPSRQCFTSVPDLTKALARHLTRSELAQVDRFLVIRALAP
jgi:hypothetical protein